jgi:hypothetical protein
MQDRQTKTIVQVSSGADQIEKAQNGSAKVILLGGGGLPAWARKKNEKYYELRDVRHRQQGQDRELYPNLSLIGEVLHCSTPPTPKRSKTEGKKKWFGKGWCGRFKKERPIHSFFRPIDTSAES